MIKTIEDVIEFAFGMMKKRRRNKGEIMDYECAMSRAQTHGIACEAMLVVFQRRQTKMRLVVEWLRARLSQSDLKQRSRHRVAEAAELDVK
ncbi:hypothetical protein K461DRAFT_281018 [Myriangium duriaei CBS 260.36]|uniref:Uncharacterized protein n=1 Tax=Myriangium duriaei CBS 260.36 TaxID=1168546 RepID=A0A9P4IY04_9PEZI|nr:hypothetical protein K461DRAFT_281018 [Myriangium duriaei CBS 260.36]